MRAWRFEMAFRAVSKQAHRRNQRKRLQTNILSVPHSIIKRVHSCILLFILTLLLLYGTSYCLLVIPLEEHTNLPGGWNVIGQKSAPDENGLYTQLSYLPYYSGIHCRFTVSLYLPIHNVDRMLRYKYWHPWIRVNVVKPSNLSRIMEIQSSKQETSTKQCAEASEQH